MTYTNWKLADLMLYLDLLDCGIPPNFIKEHFSQTGYFAMAGEGVIIQESIGDPDRTKFLVINFNALAYYKSGDKDRRGPHVADHVFKGRQARPVNEPSLLEEAVTEHPGVTVNLSRRLQLLREAVEEVLPGRLEDITFYPTRSGLKDGQWA